MLDTTLILTSWFYLVSRDPLLPSSVPLSQLCFSRIRCASIEEICVFMASSSFALDIQSLQIVCRGPVCHQEPASLRVNPSAIPELIRTFVFTRRLEPQYLSSIGRADISTLIQILGLHIYPPIPTSFLERTLDDI